MRLLLSSVAVTTLFFSHSPCIAADAYSCEVKAAYHLSDDGVVRPDNLNKASRFMIEKNNGNTVGTFFNQYVEGWNLIQRGSRASSLVSEGMYMGKPIYRIVVYSFNDTRQKPFVVEDQVNAGFIQIFSGLCE